MRTDRRAFLELAGGAAAAAALTPPAFAQPMAWLEITIAGLCVLVKRPDKGNGIDVIVPNAPGHVAQLSREGDAPYLVRDRQVIIPGLSGPVMRPQSLPCDAQGGVMRDLLPLNQLISSVSPIQYPEPKPTAGSRNIVSYMELHGGALSLIDNTSVPGINGIWKVVWQGTTRQALVEEVKFRVQVPAGDLGIKLTSMNDLSNSTPTPYSVKVNETLSLRFENTIPGMSHNNIGALYHVTNLSAIFAPTTTTASPISALLDGVCLGHSLGSLQMPSAEFKKKWLEQGAQSKGAGVFKVGNQEYLFTADDPICPVSYIEP
jgi:hypothetical protein